MQVEASLDPQAADVLAAFRQANPFSHNLPLPPSSRRRASRYILEGPPTPFTQEAPDPPRPASAAQKPAEALGTPPWPDRDAASWQGRPLAAEPAAPATPSPAKPPMAPLASPFAALADQAAPEPSPGPGEAGRRSSPGPAGPSLIASSGGGSSSGALGADSPFPLPAAVASRYEAGPRRRFRVQGSLAPGHPLLAMHAMLLPPRCVPEL